MNINLKELDFNDEKILNKIYNWRNEESARKNFINTNEINYKIFEIIIQKYKDSNIIPYIIFYDNEECGIIYFTLDNNNIYIGINIDINYRGKNIGKNAINMMLSDFQIKYSNVNKIYSKIKKTNIASINIFSKYFFYLNEDDSYINFIYYNIKYILCSNSSYYTTKLYNKLCKNYNNEWKLITDNNIFKTEVIKLRPIKCFFFHWSHIVPKNIYTSIECINFHTANLPFGRGGSPLQNQILNGTKNIYINSLKITNDGIDSGPSYNKTKISLQGNIFDIFILIGDNIYNLITDIINNKIDPIILYNYNNISIFNRIKDNNIILENKSLEEIYDQIRMRDSEYYEKTYLEIGKFKISFSRSYFNGEKIICDAIIENK